jgi:hypothetical protein
MSGPIVAASFTTGGNASTGGNPSDVCVIPTSRTQMRITLTGCDASNSVKSQKRTTPGGTFVDQTTYTTNQNATPIVVVAGEEWRLITIAQQAIREIRYVLDAQ